MTLSNHRPEGDPPRDPDRRRFVAHAATAAVAAPFALANASRARADAVPPLETDPFDYEIVRTEAEWRAMLSDDEYEVMRDRWTELPRSSDLWDDYREGEFACRGCGLHVYSSAWRVPIDKGWVFFAHAQPATVLTDIDGPQASYGMDPNGPGNMIEAHCRRCGSHLGHILIVERQLVHCINGRSLSFSPSEA